MFHFSNASVSTQSCYSSGELTIRCNTEALQGAANGAMNSALFVGSDPQRGQDALLTMRATVTSTPSYLGRCVGAYPDEPEPVAGTVWKSSGQLHGAASNGTQG